MSGKSTNLILITLDSVRQDHLGCYGYPKNTSPNIDSLASSGIKFTQVISNGGSTPQAFPAILASTYPPLHPKGYKEILRTNTTIGEVLKEEGYSTAAFHCNPWLSRFYYCHKGFEVFDDGFKDSKQAQLLSNIRRKIGNTASTIPLLNKLPIPFHIGRGHPLSAEDITDRAIHWLRNRPGRFFLWLHFMDAHLPYTPPPELLRHFLPQALSRRKMFKLAGKVLKNATHISRVERETLICLYDASIAYMDSAIGRLLEELRGETLNNTVIIVTADHGEAFGEHGSFFHNAVYEPVIRVPLIIKTPTIKEGVVIDGQHSLMDIAPTIIDLLGVKRVENFRGKSLLPVTRDKAGASPFIINVAFDPYSVKTAISYRTEDWKYITVRDKSGSIRQELYNLKDDPGEINNLEQREGGKVREAESIILDYVSTLAKDRVGGRSEKEKIGDRIRELKKAQKI